jgi:hypothetical protein
MEFAKNDDSNPNNTQNKATFSNTRIVLRFSSVGKVFSFLMPLSWTVKRLKNFISYSFKEDVKNSLINLYYGARLIQNENSLVEAYLNQEKDRSELHQIIVVLKTKEQINDNKNTPNKTISSKYSNLEKKEIVKIKFI